MCILSMPDIVHVLKTWPTAFQAMWLGYKAYELRRDDRKYRVGDQVKLLEWEPIHEGPCDWLSDHCMKCNKKSGEPDVGSYTNRYISAEISYITRDQDFPGLEEGFVILGLHILTRFPL